MAPPRWVLLDPIVRFVKGGFAVGAGKAGAAVGGSIRDLWSLEEEALLAAMEPHPVVADPPEVTRLSMVLRKMPASQAALEGFISSTDGGLVVLYTGGYLPGNGAYTPSGCYLVYDARSNSFSKIPQLDPLTTKGPPTIKCLGAIAAILHHGRGGEGAYVLAELVTTLSPGLPDAELYLWWSSSSTSNSDGAWMRTPVRLPLPPELCGPTYFFNIDMTFSFAGSRVCWVDLLTGVLICDVFAPQGPEFSFVPLPQGYSFSVPHDIRLAIKTQEFRSMGCACGAIKFVALMGYSEGLPNDQVILKTWTLSPDLKEWQETSVLPMVDLWASESFSRMELPRVRPMFPILSMTEDGVVCIFLNEIGLADKVGHNCGGQIFGKRRLVLNGHHALRVDLVQNKVLCSKRSKTNSLGLLGLTLIASDFSAYLHRPKQDRQRGEETSSEEASMKRTKY